MENYFSSGAWLVQVLGIGIIVMSILYSKERYEIDRKKGSIYFLVNIVYLLPWYVVKGLIILLGLFFILLPILGL